MKAARIIFLFIWLGLPLVLLLIASHSVGAQNSVTTNNERCRTITLTQTGTATLTDTLTIAPNTPRLSVTDTALKSTLSLSLNTQSNAVLITGGQPYQQVEVCYRVWPLLLTKPIYKRKLSEYDSSRFYFDNQGYKPASINGIGRPDQLFATPDINKSGTLARGISFGNTQNVFVNSALNLQLEGKLTENLKLTALLSDQKVPFQPQGNTQNIREFDKVLVQLDAPIGRLMAGDIVLQQPVGTHFLRYYKNVQGGQVAIKNGIDTTNGGVTTAAISIAKGRFASTIVPVQEGVQGPYRLQAPSDNQFVIILANTERVYLDGRLLKRGFNQDYVIDYNLAEVTLNTSIVITAFSRLRIDFEYAERNYSRSIFNITQSQTIGALKLYANHYQEQDNPDRPLSFTLDNATAAILANAGDSANKAVISGATLVTDYSKDQILYFKKDTVGYPDSIYVYSNIYRPNLYNVTFSDVGQGNGAYALLNGQTNGRIYTFVGAKNGSYLPVRRIITPNQRKMTTIGGSFLLPKNAGSVYADFGYSTYNVNRYALDNAATKTGTATRVGYTLSSKPEKTLKKYLNAEYEGLSTNFNPIDRFRSIEFDRDWNANTADTLRANDNVFNLTGSLTKDPYNQVTTKLTRRSKGINVNGWQQTTSAAKSIGKLYASVQLFNMRNNRPDYNAAWDRLEANINLKTRYIVPGYQYSQEKNIISFKRNGADTTAMYFTQHKVSLRNNDTLRTTFYADFAVREDKAPKFGLLTNAYNAQTLNLGTKHNLPSNGLVALVFTYRSLKSNIAERVAPEETFQGRADYNTAAASNHIRSEVTYTAATGQELKREYRFVAVAPGQGTHQWLDYNNDGIQQLDEFVEAAAPNDRIYIKIFIPTATYIRAYTTNLNYRLTTQGPRHWRDGNNLQRFVNKLSTVSAIQIDKKLTGTSLGQRYNPLTDIDNNNLIATNQTLRNTFFFNRTASKYGAELQLNNARLKTLLTGGFESRITSESRLTLRRNLGSRVNVQLLGATTERNNASDFLANRNYNIVARDASLEFSYQPSSSFRVSVQPQQTTKTNTTAEDVATFNRFLLEVRYNKVSKTNINSSIRYIQIDYKGVISSPAGYEMLEALQPGGNFIFNFNWQQKLANGLQLLITYEGRKAGTQSVVHIGQMQLTALF